MRKLTYLWALLLSICGWSYASAQTTETFDDVTVVEGTMSGYGAKLSNGWVCVSSSGSEYSYGIGTKADNDNASYFLSEKRAYDSSTKSLGTVSSSSNSYYLVIPVLMTGVVSFQMCTNSESERTYGIVKIYKVTDNGDGTYKIGSQIGSNITKAGKSSYPWEKKTIDIGEDETMVAINSTRSFIDDFTYTPYVETGCKKPTNLTVSNLTTNSADLNWTAGDEDQTQWQVVYSTDANFDKDAAEAVNVSTTSYSFTGLNPNTQYYAAVRSYCSVDDQSKWVTINFKTEKESVPAAGFTDDFETDKGWDLINGTVPNKWVRGTGVSNGGSYSLYISQDGSTYPSDYGGSSLVYASKLFNFEAGDYTISYDWKCNGETNYDFLRVGLVPGSVELAASTSYSLVGSSETLPTGWTMWLDGGSPLQGNSSWDNKSVDINIATAGVYQVVFAWRNDYSGGSNPAAIDNFMISRKQSTEQVTVTSAGFATYVSDNNLDYTGLDVKAYKAAVEGKKITFTKVEKVPAGQGVLLQNEGTFNVPVATDVEAWTDNAFIRGTGAAVASEVDGKYNYILNVVDNEVGFYLANDQVVGTNRAYLQSTTNNARIAIVIEDDGIATTIEAAEIFGQATDSIYDLQGRKVNGRLTKGLYIVNGKKVIIK